MVDKPGLHLLKIMTILQILALFQSTQWGWLILTEAIYQLQNLWHMRLQIALEIFARMTIL